MKRNDFISKVEEMVKDGQKSYITPTKAVDSGKASKGFEGLIKLLLNNTRGNKVVSSPKGVDTFKTIDNKKCSFEIKSNAGELVQLDYNSNTIKSVFNNDYVIYNPDFDPNDSIDYIVNHSYVVSGKGFESILEMASATRLKYSTAELRASKQYGTEPRHDRLTVRSTKRGDKKRTEIISVLDSQAISLVDFAKEHNIELNFKGL